jgi:iron complex transport system substrate-binding protein
MFRAALVTLVVVAVLAPAVAGAAAGSVPQGCGFPVTATDATGTQVTVPEEPRRVVVLAPSAAQTMWEIGAESKVVGMPVNEYTASLPGSRERTDVVGTNNNPVQSRVVALEPDLVLAPNVVTNGTVANLRRAGLTVYRFRGAESLSDVYAKTELTGRLVGARDRALGRTAEMRAAVRAVERAVAGREAPDVYYALGGGWTAGEETFVGDIVERAGGDNIAAAANITSYRPISQEVVAEHDPDWIVVPGGTPLPRTAAVNGSTAVRTGQVLRVNANYVNQPGPRTTVPLRAMATAFHPDATFPTPGPVSTTPTRCSDATPADRTTDRATGNETPGATGPGFTAGVVVAALLAVTLAVPTRRLLGRR